MKKVISFMIAFILVLAIYRYRNDIIKYTIENFILDKNIEIKEKNIYYKNANYGYVKQTDNFYPKNKQDLLNIFYSILNNGWTYFEFYCDTEYKNCTNDVNDMIDHDEDTLAYIDNFVSPFNSYSKLEVSTNNFGKVEVNVYKLYSDNEITKINSRIDQILKKIIKNNMTNKEKIKAIHDYIINNTSYDQDFNRNSDNNIYSSEKAIGPLFQGKAICSGYSDAMALFLDKLGIKNYKIISKDHVWNYVYLDKKWYHLDLTWDDPVTDSNKDVLLHNFFLISTKEIESLNKKINTNHHDYDKSVYVEAK